MNMAIAAIAHQNITINTPFMLDVNITGNPTHAWCEGLLEGFHTKWNDPTLRIRGDATRLINNSPFTVWNSNGESRSSTFSVVSAAPVITNPGTLTLIKGIEFDQIVKITNAPALVQAKGPWSGLKYEPHSDGIRLFGPVPTTDNFHIPSDRQKIQIVAETGELRDELDAAFNIKTLYYYAARNTDDIYRIDLNRDDEDISSNLDFDTNYGQIRWLDTDTDYIYFSSLANRKAAFKVPINTGDGESVNATKIGSNFANNGLGIAIDGNDAYRIEEVSGNELIRVFNKNTGSTSRTFRLDWNHYGRGIAIDGDDLIVVYFQNSPARLRWYNKNTSNNRSATHTKEIRLPGSRSGVHDITFFDNKIYVTNTTDNNIIVIDKNTENGQRATALETHDVPASLRDIYGIATYIG